MTLPYHIQVGDPLTTSQIKKIKALILKTFDQINQTYNHWNPNSELSHLNQDPNAKVSPKLTALIKRANEIKALTNGRFDPTIGKLIDLWKKSMRQGYVPSLEEIQEAQQDTATLDLDGIAKGQGVDELLLALKSEGLTSLYIDWGGDIAVFGNHPSGRPWQVMMEKGHKKIQLKEGGLATSGNYIQRYTFKHEGEVKTFSHIIDPLTGFAIKEDENAPISVTVYASSCALADSLATAILCSPTLKDAHNLCTKIQTKYPNTQFWIISYNNKLLFIN